MLSDPPGPKVQYFTATTLDGFIADADNSLDWLFAVERDEDDRSWHEFIDGVGALVMGATTYEWVLGHEPATTTESPDKWRGYYDDRPTWVFTHRKLPRIPGIDLTFVQGDVRAVHDRIVGGPCRGRTSGSSGAATWWSVRRRRAARRDPARPDAGDARVRRTPAAPPHHVGAAAPAQRRAERSARAAGLRGQPAADALKYSATQPVISVVAAPGGEHLAGRPAPRGRGCPPRG